MSRVGKLPISIPDGVQVDLNGLVITIKGPKGFLVKEFSGAIDIVQENKEVKVIPHNKSKESKSMWGTARSIIYSMVKGVNTGYTDELEVNGVGYRAAVKGKYLNLTLGKSHNTKIEIPSYIKLDTPKQNIIIVESIDKEKMGQFIALVRKQRPPEPYKGKGIKKKDEFVQRKEGKKN